MYKIRLEHFEGPLDLLLFFIKRDELDIYDIPISRITMEFMEYLKLMEQLDLDIAGDFILMAATLMQIKVRMLLPKEIDDRGDEIDPRSDLVKALLEYKRYKEMSEEFSFMEANQRKLSFRGNLDSDPKESPVEIDTLLKDVTIYDLMKAFKMALMDRPAEPIHEIRKWNVSIDDQIEVILNKIDDDEELHFTNLVVGMKQRFIIIVTFIAMLELIKMGKIGLRESERLNDFVIYGINNG